MAMTCIDCTTCQNHSFIWVSGGNSNALSSEFRPTCTCRAQGLPATKLQAGVVASTNSSNSSAWRNFRRNMVEMAGGPGISDSIWSAYCSILCPKTRRFEHIMVNLLAFSSHVALGLFDQLILLYTSPPLWTIEIVKQQALHSQMPLSALGAKREQVQKTIHFIFTNWSSLIIHHINRYSIRYKQLSSSSDAQALPAEKCLSASPALGKRAWWWGQACQPSLQSPAVPRANGGRRTGAPPWFWILLSRHNTT